jgi:hypothetical protein
MNDDYDDDQDDEDQDDEEEQDKEYDNVRRRMLFHVPIDRQSVVNAKR